MSELLKELRESQDAPETLEKGSRGTGSAICYRVQARMSVGCGPKDITGATVGMGKQVLTDSKWETLHFPQGPVGVPPSRFMEQYAQHSYFSYTAAQALRWWFLAEQGGIGGIETRLVEYKFEYSFGATAIRSICLVDPEKREDILPDWGSKPANPPAQAVNSLREHEDS